MRKLKTIIIDDTRIIISCTDYFESCLKTFFFNKFIKTCVIPIVKKMSKAPAKRAPKKKGANGYKLPDPIPKGEIVVDLKKQKWIIGSSIGVGGFGEIYSGK